MSTPIAAAHRRRLREVWRSAGWPFQDLIEAELLAAGLLSRERDAAGRETLRLTEAGIAELVHTLQSNRAARGEHEALVARVAREMQRAGRVVWRGLSLRARVDVGSIQADEPAEVRGIIDGDVGSGRSAATDGGRWAMVMPDVYSIRHTTVEDYVEPVVHEIKVRRADLLADLRRPAKGEAYRWLSGECWYVLKDGIARPQEIPEVYGVMLAPPTGPLAVVRPAPRRAKRLPFAVWMALARATPEPVDDEAQARLGDGDDSPPA